MNGKEGVSGSSPEEGAHESPALIGPGVIGADILKTTYLRRSRLSESKLYFGLVRSPVGIGIVVLLVGVDQPLVLRVISACAAEAMMFMYSLLLLLIIRRSLPEAINVRGLRAGVLVFKDQSGKLS